MALMDNEDPGPSKDHGTDTAEVGDATTVVGSAAGMLAIAQRLHEEHVADGQETRQRLISEGQSRHDQLIGEAKQKRDEVLQELGSERSRLQNQIEELQTSKRDHHDRQKSYLEGQLIKLEESATDESS